MKYNPEISYGTCFPSKLFDVDLNYSFYLHDEEYGNRVKERGTRKEADIALMRNVYSLFEKKDKNILGYFVGISIYIGIRLFGWIRWYKEVK